MKKTYLDWLIEETQTVWWHDSADEAEVDLGLQRGAIGITTNPVLVSAAVTRNRARWGAAIDRALARNLPPEQKAEALTGVAVTRAAERLMPAFECRGGRAGFVCAQVNPARAGDRDSSRMAWRPRSSSRLASHRGR